VRGSASRPGRSLPPGNTRYPLYRRLGGPQGRSGQEQKISPQPGFDPRTVQSVASRYTDYATRTTRVRVMCSLSRSNIEKFAKSPSTYRRKAKEDCWTGRVRLQYSIGGCSHNKLSIFVTVDNHTTVPHYRHSTPNGVRLVTARTAKWHNFKAFHIQDFSCDVLVESSLVYFYNMTVLVEFL
jgi:hypothetical protein